MDLSDEEVILIRRSFDVLRTDPEQKSMQFYETLFAMAPGMRALFRDDLAGQGMRFMSTLREIVETLHEEAPMPERFRELGEGHAALGITADHFAVMGEALIGTLRFYLGDGFTPATEGAWRTAYAQISAEIMEAGGIAPL